MASEVLGPWWHLPAAFLLTIVGILSHELAHAAMMYPVAERVRIDVNNIWMAEIHCESEILDEEWRHKWADAAGFAPLIFATVIVTALWLSGNMPSTTSVLGWGIWHALLWFGLLGGFTDYSRGASLQTHDDGESEQLPGLVRAMSDGGQAFVKGEQRLLTTLSVALLAAAAGLLYYMAYDGLVRQTAMAMLGVAMLISVASIGILLRRSQEYDHQLFAAESD